MPATGNNRGKRTLGRLLSLAGRVAVVGTLLCASIAQAAGPDIGAAGTRSVSQSPDIVSRYADLTSDCQGLVHAVWVEEDGGDSFVNSINYARWDGSGWTEPSSIRLAWNVLLPVIAADPQGALHLVYVSGSYLYYSRTYGGAPESARSWSSPVQIGQQAADDNLRWANLRVDDRGRLHVLYVLWHGATGNPTLDSEVDYVQSNDGGATWSMPVRVSDPGVLSALPGTSGAMALDAKGAIYATWTASAAAGGSAAANAVLFARSADDGYTWSAPRVMSGPNAGQAMAVVVDGRGQVILVWYREGREFVYQQSPDQGRNWTAPALIYLAQSDITRYGYGSIVADSAGAVHLVVPIDGFDLGYFAWSGTTWTGPARVTAGLGRQSYWPRVAIAAGNRLNVVWNEGYPELALPNVGERLARGEYEILHKEVQLDAPAVAPACQPLAVPRTPAVTGSLAANVPAPTAPVVLTPVPSAIRLGDPPASANTWNQAIALGVVPPILLVMAVAIVYTAKRRR